MVVFILCTGRTGSSTIIRACKHINNFTAGHESLSATFGEARFQYPDDHIEADNRLSWRLGQLDTRYGDEAFYVHLKRDQDQVANSFVKRFYERRSIIDAFCEGMQKTLVENMTKEQQLEACHDYIDTVNANIEHFLKDKTHTMRINLETMEEDFKLFWQGIGARGDLDKALGELRIQHNASRKRRWNFFHRMRLVLIREGQHFIRSWQS